MLPSFDHCNNYVNIWNTQWQPTMTQLSVVIPVSRIHLHTVGNINNNQTIRLFLTMVLVLQYQPNCLIRALTPHIILSRRVPVWKKSSVCLICMKYRKIILIIIIISLGKISLSYIANTSRTHACKHARAHTLTLAKTHTPCTPPPTVAIRCIGAPNQSVMVGRTAFEAGETMAGR